MLKGQHKKLKKRKSKMISDKTLTKPEGEKNERKKRIISDDINRHRNKSINPYFKQKNGADSQSTQSPDRRIQCKAREQLTTTQTTPKVNTRLSPDQHLYDGRTKIESHQSHDDILV